MKKRVFLSALAMMAAGFATNMNAAIATQLTITDGTNVVTVDVSDTNVTTCTDSSAGAICSGLSINNGQAHKTLLVSGTIGDFEVAFTGKGGLASTRPTLQNLNQLNAKNNGGAGSLTATFTDTNYTDISSILNIGVSGVDDQQINASTSSFYAYFDPSNGVPSDGLGSLIGSFVNQQPNTGGPPATSFSNGGNFINAAGSSGSLMAKTVLAFAGQGTMQANLTIANILVPEPASVVFLGTTLLGLSALFRRKMARR